MAQALVAEAVADRAVGDPHLARRGVHDGRLPHRVLAATVGMVDVAGHEVLAGTPDTLVAVDRFEADEVGQVGEALVVVGEERDLPVDEVLLEDDVAHRHRQGSVGAGSRGHPLVGELDVLGVVGSDRDHLLAAVACLGHPVGIGRAGHRDVGAPHDQVPRVPPVAGLGNVGLVPEHLRGRVGQVGVPVVERQHRRADQLQEARSRGVGHRGHRRDRREARDPVGAPALDRVDVGGGHDLGDLVPARSDQAPLAACRLVAARLVGVLDDRAPGDDGVAVRRLGLAEHLQQHAAHVGIADPGRRVGVPGEGCPARAPSRLVLRPVGAGGGVVGLLGLPGDDPVLDVDLPGAGPGAVHAMGRAHHLVVAPAVAVERVALASALLVKGALVGRHGGPREELAGADQRTGQRALEAGGLVSHGRSPRRRIDPARPPCYRRPEPGAGWCPRTRRGW